MTFLFKFHSPALLRSRLRNTGVEVGRLDPTEKATADKLEKLVQVAFASFFVKGEVITEVFQDANVLTDLSRFVT